MSIRKILQDPDPILRTLCVPVEAGEDISALLRDLADTCCADNYGEVHGVGLAANQIGSLKRVLVIRPEGQGSKKVDALVNPEIIFREKMVVGPEQCLSLPGVKVQVKRWKVIKVLHGQPGNQRVTKFKDFAARVVQHEMDHLDGLLIVDVQVGKERATAAGAAGAAATHA